jgi:hypothetical protein
MTDKHADAVHRFLRGWFKTVRFMKANKDATIRTSGKTIEIKPSIMEKVYATQIASFSDDGAWDMAAIDVIRHSLNELGILNRIPDAKELYTDKFVPVRF